MVVYLDNAATTPLAPEIIKLLDLLNHNLYANPSSLHSLGKKSQKELEASRETIAEIINAEVDEVIFTSGATEANNMVFNILDYDLLITSPAEHASVIEPAKASGKPVIWLELDKEGFIDLDDLELKLASNISKKVLVSIMHGNNEIGTIQDIERIGELCAKHDNVAFHSDIVQTFTKHSIDVKKNKADFLSSSAHKIHGPKGVGFLYFKKSLQDDKALIIGGGQENNLRSGTENLHGIIAFARAAELADKKSEHEKISKLQKKLYDGLSQIEGFVLNGPPIGEKRVLGNLNFSLLNSSFSSEALVLQADLKGLALSSGSACSSNKGEAMIESSYVLRACRLSEEIAAKAVRLSISRLNTEAEIEEVIKIISDIAMKSMVCG